jgi:hypothetical protein
MWRSLIPRSRTLVSIGLTLVALLADGPRAARAQNIWAQVDFGVDAVSWTSSSTNAYDVNNPVFDPANITSMLYGQNYLFDTSASMDYYLYGPPYNVPSGGGIAKFLYSPPNINGLTAYNTFVPQVYASIVPSGYSVNNNINLTYSGQTLSNQIVAATFVSYGWVTNTGTVYVLSPESVIGSSTAPPVLSGPLVSTTFNTSAGGVEIDYPAYQWVDLGPEPVNLKLKAGVSGGVMQRGLVDYETGAYSSSEVQ